MSSYSTNPDNRIGHWFSNYGRGSTVGHDTILSGLQNWKGRVGYVPTLVGFERVKTKQTNKQKLGRTMLLNHQLTQTMPTLLNLAAQVKLLLTQDRQYSLKTNRSPLKCTWRGSLPWKLPNAALLFLLEREKGNLQTPVTSAFFWTKLFPSKRKDDNWRVCDGKGKNQLAQHNHLLSQKIILVFNFFPTRSPCF